MRWWLVSGLVLVAAACAPSARPEAGTPQAVATDTRRTAVAEVQRIIAGAQPTMTPVVTPSAAPSCSGAIWWYEARRFIGEARLVEGPVIRTRPGPNATTLIEIGQPYPDPTGLAVFVPGGAIGGIAGKTVCVTGRIVSREGSTSIEAQTASAVSIVN